MPIISKQKKIVEKHMVGFEELAISEQLISLKAFIKTYEEEADGYASIKSIINDFYEGFEKDILVLMFFHHDIVERTDKFENLESFKALKKRLKSLIS